MINAHLLSPNHVVSEILEASAAVCNHEYMVADISSFLCCSQFYTVIPHDFGFQKMCKSS